MIDYGYDDAVLLPVEMKPPVNLKTGSSVTFSATVRRPGVPRDLHPGQDERGAYVARARRGGHRRFFVS